MTFNTDKYAWASNEVTIVRNPTKDYGALVPEVFAATIPTPSAHSSLMIGLWLETDQAEQLAQPGYESQEELHLTLCYLGKSGSYTSEQIASIMSMVAKTCAKFTPLHGYVTGVGRFPASESSDGKDVIYATVDIPNLLKLREDIADQLKTIGTPPAANHAYTPHITLAYIDHGALSPIDSVPHIPLVFSNITVSIGSSKIHLPLYGRGQAQPTTKAYLPSDYKRLEDSDKAKQPLQDKMQKWVDDLFNAQEQSIIAKLQGRKFAPVPLQKFPDDDAALFSESDWEAYINAESRPYLYDAYITGGKYGIDEFGYDFVPEGKVLGDWLSAAATALAVAVTATTAKRLFDQTKFSRRLNEKTDVVIGRVKDLFQDFRNTRSQSIARTETGTAFHQGMLESYRTVKVKAKRWITAHDERVDFGDLSGPCWRNELAGPIPLDQAFPSGHMAPTAHPRCRCSLSPVQIETTERVFTEASQPIPLESWDIYQALEPDIIYEQLGTLPVSITFNQVAGTLTSDQIERMTASIPRRHLVAAHPNTSVPPGMSKPPNLAGLRIAILDEVQSTTHGGKLAGEYLPDRDFIRLSTGATPSPFSFLPPRQRSLADIQSTLRHEIGHRVEEVFNLSYDQEFAALTKKHLQTRDLAHPHFHYPSVMSTTIGDEAGQRELFAQVYELYLSDRSGLRRVAPDLEEYMTRKVFTTSVLRSVAVRHPGGAAHTNQDVHAGDTARISLDDMENSLSVMTRYFDAGKGPAGARQKEMGAKDIADSLRGDRSWTRLRDVVLERGTGNGTIKLKKGQDPDTAVATALTKRWDFFKPGLSIFPAFQLAAKAEFNISDAEIRHFKPSDMTNARDSWLNEHEGGFRNFLRVQYEATQRKFNDLGLTAVSGFRVQSDRHDSTGLSFMDQLRQNPLNNARTGMQKLQPISSFTSDPVLLEKYHKTQKLNRITVMGMSIPKRLILGTSATGFGDPGERELVVLGGDHRVRFTEWVVDVPPALAKQRGVVPTRIDGRKFATALFQ